MQFVRFVLVGSSTLMFRRWGVLESGESAHVAVFNCQQFYSFTPASLFYPRITILAFPSFTVPVVLLLALVDAAREWSK